ncbi:MAG: DUF4339 domain-containing protein [Bacteroidia bacterium]
MKEYFFLKGKSQNGPFTIEQLAEKELTSETLIWTEGMESWQKLKDIPELLQSLKPKQVPPPIPRPSDKPLKVAVKTSKKKDKLITEETEVIVAKETKSIFQQIFIGLLIGIIAFPIFYFGIYEADKYDNFKTNDIVSSSGDQRVTGINLSDFPFSWSRTDSEGIRRNIERRKEIYTEQSAYSSLITFLVATGFLIAITYVSKGAKWVEKTSRKKI